MSDRQWEYDPDVRFGFYLRPSYAMSRAQAEMHDLLRRQFGAVTAGAFMPHATIKGFFRSDATIAELNAVLDAVMAGRISFPVFNGGPVPFGERSIVLDAQHDETGATNAPLQQLHEAAYAALLPLVRPECTFTPGEGVNDRFFAHLTLLQGLTRAELFEEVRDFIDEARPIGPSTFMAEYCHLYAFRSENWAGDWGATLIWELLASWKLRPLSVRDSSP